MGWWVGAIYIRLCPNVSSFFSLSFLFLFFASPQPVRLFSPSFPKLPLTSISVLVFSQYFLPPGRATHDHSPTDIVTLHTFTQILNLDPIVQAQLLSVFISSCYNCLDYEPNGLGRYRYRCPCPCPCPSPPVHSHHILNSLIENNILVVRSLSLLYSHTPFISFMTQRPLHLKWRHERAGQQEQRERE